MTVVLEILDRMGCRQFEGGCDEVAHFMAEHCRDCECRGNLLDRWKPMRESKQGGTFFVRCWTGADQLGARCDNHPGVEEVVVHNFSVGGVGNLKRAEVRTRLWG